MMVLALLEVSPVLIKSVGEKEDKTAAASQKRGEMGKKSAKNVSQEWCGNLLLYEYSRIDGGRRKWTLARHQATGWVQEKWGRDGLP